MQKKVKNQGIIKKQQVTYFKIDTIILNKETF